METETLEQVPAIEKDDLRIVCEHFNIIAVNASKCYSPTLCNVYKVNSLTGVYGIKIYPEIYNEAELTSEIDLIKNLEDADCSVPHHHRSIDNKLYCILPSKRKAAVYSWIVGEHLNLSYFRTQLLMEMVDKIIPVARNTVHYRDSDWVWIEFIRYLSEIIVPNDLIDWIKIHTAIKSPWNAKNKLLLCHNDISARNIIWKFNSGKPVLIDFTNTISAPLEWEFATMTANITLENSFEGNLNDLKNFVKQSKTATQNIIDWNYYEYLLLIAFAQRAVFMIRGNKETQHESIWRRLRTIIKENNLY